MVSQHLLIPIGMTPAWRSFAASHSARGKKEAQTSEALLELCSEFFHCRVFPGNFTRLAIVQGYLRGDRATENSLIDIAKRARHESSQPTDPGRGMSVANDDAGAKNGEAGKTDVAYGVFLHPHDAGVAKPAAGRASCGRKQAKLGDPGIVAAARKGTDNAEFKPLQFFFAPAHRSGTDAHATHRADGTLGQNFAGDSSRALGKVNSAGIKNNVSYPRSRRNGLSGDHHHFPAFRNCQQLRDGRTADLSGTTEDHYREILIHEQDLCEGKNAIAPFTQEGNITGAGLTIRI
jgi:hypothetical protein